MTTKQFGTLLIVLGCLVSFIIFSMSDWLGGDRSFLTSFRYSKFYGKDCDWDGNCAFLITLSQALIFPTFIVALGFCIKQGIISQKIVSSILPFVKVDS